MRAHTTEVFWSDSKPQGGNSYECRHAVPNNKAPIAYDNVIERRSDGVTVRTHRRLTVELSGAHAGVRAWHFILHPSAPAIC
jgi:hypothetical protein